MIYVRAVFRKTGTLKYISHLDLQRAMTRLLLRSGLPVCFSEGFNPHPKLTFAQPLSIYQESLCECMEFRMEDVHPSEEETLNALRSVCPAHGLTFTEVHFSERKTPPCKAAEYDLYFTSDRTASEMEALFFSPLTVTKKTKTGEKETDITPLVTERKIMAWENGLILHCVLPCGDLYLNPNYVGQALSSVGTLEKVIRTALIF